MFNDRLLTKHKLKMTFKFSRFSITKQYDAIKTNDYSLRNLADESNLEISYNKKFYLLAYILPYERKDGSKSWCDVGTAGYFHGDSTHVEAGCGSGFAAS